MEKNLLNKRELQKQYRMVGVVLFGIAVGTLMMRILVYFISDHVSDFGLDAIFSICVQVGVLFIMPLLVYKIALKKEFSDVFRFSNFRKTKPANLLIAVGMGSISVFVTMGVSLAWLIIISIFGYTPNASASSLPENLNVWMFLGSMFLTAVLPGFCEEFAMRGGFLSSLRTAFPVITVILISSLSFGLFHQYIVQLFYTACFGGLMAFITIRTKSIFPAMIIHFMNNGTSVYIDYAQQYNWPGSGIMYSINNSLTDSRILLLIFAYIVITTIFCLLVFLLAKLNPKEVVRPVMANGRSSFHGRGLSTGNLLDYVVEKAPPLELNKKISPRMVAPNPYFMPPADEQLILFVNNRYFLLHNNVLYALKLKMQYKPRLCDNVFYIGAIVVTALSTIFSFIWGFAF